MQVSNYMQADIIQSLGVSAAFDVTAEQARRSRFLVDCLMDTGRRSLVLGISGGVDSLAAGLLAQRAVNQVRQLGREASFIAVRLPYGTQADEADAQQCLRVIEPDLTLTVDIRPAVDAVRNALQASGMVLGSASEQDFLLSRRPFGGFCRQARQPPHGTLCSSDRPSSPGNQPPQQ